MFLVIIHLIDLHNDIKMLAFETQAKIVSV